VPGKGGSALREASDTKTLRGVVKMWVSCGGRQNGARRQKAATAPQNHREITVASVHHRFRNWPPPFGQGCNRTADGRNNVHIHHGVPWGGNL